MNNRNVYYTYIYLDPRKNGHFCYNNICFLFEPIYIGKGKNKRYLEHTKYLDKHINPKFKNKLLRILSQGFTKQDIENHIQIISCNSEQEAFGLEVKLIKEIDPRNLCNLTDGGEGNSGYIQTEESKKKISEAKTGKKQTEKTKKKISEAHVGMKFSESQKKKISESKSGKKRGPYKKNNLQSGQNNSMSMTNRLKRSRNKLIFLLRRQI